MPRRRIFTLFALLALPGAVSAAAGPVLAEAEQLMQLSLEQLLDVEVVSASKFSQPSERAPAAVTVLNAEDIRRFGWRSLAEALSSVPGFHFTSDRIYKYAGVRGFSPPGDYNDRLLVMVDGHRVNDNIFDSGFLDSAFPLDLDLVDRIEVVRGPGSSLYGGNALFGVVNVITRTGAALGGGEAALALGRYGSDRERLSFGRRLENGADWLLSVSRERSPGGSLQFRDIPDNGGVTSGTDYDRNQSVFAKYALDGLALEAGVSRRDKGNPAAYTGTVFNDPGNYLRDQVAFLDARYGRALADGARADGRLFFGAYDYTGNYLYANPPGPATLNLDLARGRWWGGEFKLLRDLGGHRVSAGMEYQDDFRQDQINYDRGGATNVDERHAGRRWGLYVQDDFRWSEASTFSAGGRYDRVSGSGAMLSPRLALVSRLSGDTVLKLLYGSAFRAPNNYELYYSYPGQQEANPALKPERIRTWEADLEHWLGKSLRLSLAAYLYTMKDQIAQVNDPATNLLQYRNQGDISGRGMEFGVDRQFANGARVRASLGLMAANDASGQRLDNSPRQLAKFNLLWPLAGAWQLGCEGQAIGERMSGSVRVPGYGQVNLTLSRPLKNGWELSASAYNVFDRRVQEPAGADPGILGTYGSTRSVIPADALGWRLKALYRF